MKYGNRTRAEGAIHPRPERRGFSRIQVNVDHASRIDGVIAALRTLGAGIIIEDQRQNMVAA